MVCNIKMEVTPDLSERVQEIVIANGGSWEGNYKGIQFTETKYLYLDDQKIMFCTESKDDFDFPDFKKISAYDFIASNGEQEWLPRYNESALFSRNGEIWKKFKFLRYLVGSSYPFVINNSSNYEYCKPLPKAVSFIQFLKDNDAYEAYMENIRVENQRWKSIKDYIRLEDVKALYEERWIQLAFNWNLQPQERDYWGKVNQKWQEICKSNKVVWEH